MSTPISSSFSFSARVSVTRSRGCHPGEARIVVETPLHRFYLERYTSPCQVDQLLRDIRENGVYKGVCEEYRFVDTVEYRARRLQGYREELKQL